ASDVFDFTWSCESGDGTFSANGTFQVTGSGHDETSATIPTGVSCTVTEVGLDTTSWTMTAESPGNGVVTSSANGNEVSFTNTRNVVLDLVPMSLVGDVAGAPDTFHFSYDCKAEGFEASGTFDIEGAGSHDI